MYIEKTCMFIYTYKNRFVQFYSIVNEKKINITVLLLATCFRLYY